VEEASESHLFFREDVFNTPENERYCAGGGRGEVD
jgi:hypothetical protein